MRSRGLILLVAVTAACRTEPWDDAPGADERASRELFPTQLSAEPIRLAECPAEGELVYVVDRDTQMLSAFRPDTLEFTDIAVLACDAPPGDTPQSMAVARDGTAWVEYATKDDTDAVLFLVNVHSGACAVTRFVPGPGSPPSFGMAYVPDGAGETLYILGPNGTRTSAHDFGTLDPVTLDYAHRGYVDGAGDLASDADGDLFAIEAPWSFSGPFTDLTVAKLDPRDGKTLMWFPPNWTASDIDDVAIAAWGGDLWLFIDTTTFSTTVWHLVPSTCDGYTCDNTVVLTETGRHVVGAGVAPCR